MNRDLYVMNDEAYGQDAYITTWKEFQAECKELGKNAEGANLVDLDDYLEENPAWGMGKPLKQQFIDDAHKYNIINKIQSWIEAK